MPLGSLFSGLLARPLLRIRYGKFQVSAFLPITPLFHPLDPCEYSPTATPSIFPYLTVHQPNSLQSISLRPFPLRAWAPWRETWYRFKTWVTL